MVAAIGMSWRLLIGVCCILSLTVSFALSGRTSSSQARQMSKLGSSGMPHGAAEYEQLLRNQIGTVRKVLLSRTQKFDEFFRTLLQSSKQDFHQMFIATYGLLYERNSFIFTELFGELERYYNQGGLDLNDALDEFFQKLYKKMFEVLNTQYQFDSKYLQCVGQNMEEMKPFGDIPKKLKIEVKRSFVATRTFVQALSNGKDILQNIIEIVHTFNCGRPLQRLGHCPQCGQHQPPIRACPGLCPQLLRSCLAIHPDLNKEWNNYIDALLLLSGRLETSFNIESVVDPIDIKISEAIMNFQENGIIVSQKLFEKCGKPSVGSQSITGSGPVRQAIPGQLMGRRRRRSDTPDEYMDNGFDEFNAHRRPGAAATGSRIQAGGVSLDRVISDIRRKIRKTKNFWIRMPTKTCQNTNMATAVTAAAERPDASDHPRTMNSTLKPVQVRAAVATSCWNGSDIVQSGHQDPADRRQLIKSHGGRPSTIIARQVLALKLITTKVNYAFNGVDVEWQDGHAEPSLDHLPGSGSGEPDEDSTSDDEDDYPRLTDHHHVPASSPPTDRDLFWPSNSNGLGPEDPRSVATEPSQFLTPPDVQNPNHRRVSGSNKVYNKGKRNGGHYLSNSWPLILTSLILSVHMQKLVRPS